MHRLIVPLALICACDGGTTSDTATDTDTDTTDTDTGPTLPLPFTLSSPDLLSSAGHPLAAQFLRLHPRHAELFRSRPPALTSP